MKKLTLAVSSAFAAVSYWLTAVPIWAAEERDINIRPVGKEFGRLGEITIPDIVSAGVLLILVIAALVSFIVLVIGGIKWILSGGDKAATESARNTITAALVGLLIVFGAWAIIRLIQVFFGIQILTLTIPIVGQ